MNPDEEDRTTPDPDDAEKELSEDEISADLSDDIMQMVNAIRGVGEGIRKLKEEHLTELYGDERFGDDALNFSDDLAAYDQAAYTRSTQDFGAYRYNLSESAYSYQGGWMSSWYSGYSSVDRALEGVNTHVATFVVNPNYDLLEIVPDLEQVDEQTIREEFVYQHNRQAECSTLVCRIDSSLYEKLGINEAQQHYVVDGISQVLGMQDLPDPGLITLLQSCDNPLSGVSAVIPNVIREITTELMRARGLPILLEQMPGWLKRVTAFRSVMFVGEPPSGEIPTAFLMYAIWERDVISSIEHQDALDAIQEIEEAMNQKMSNSKPERSSSSSRSRTRDVNLKQRREHRIKVFKRIQEVLVRYITNRGSVGFVYRTLTALREFIDEHAVKKQVPLEGAQLEYVVQKCSELVDPIHDHNRTFQPDPSKNEIRHLDFPDCPTRELVPSEKRGRIDLTRKCLFSLQRIPLLVRSPGPEDDPTKFSTLAIKLIDDLLKTFGGTPEQILAKAEEQILEKKGSSAFDSKSKRGVQSTHSEVLRSRAPISHGGTVRDFSIQDPDFDRGVIIYDSTISD